MTAFRYSAVGLDGREVGGVLEAETIRQARSLLRAQGLLARSVETVAENGPGRPGPGAMRLGAAELMLLTRQWSTLLEAGIPVERALNALIEQHRDERVRQLLQAIRGELLAGHPLHRALGRFPRTFDPLYRALVAAGEASGQLGRVMLRLADHLEQRGARRQKLIQAAVYPALIVLVASAVVLAMMTWVVPQVVAVFQSGKQTLPLPTRVLIAIADFLRVAWPFLLAGLGTAFWLGRNAWRLESVRRAWHARLIRLPVAGNLLIALDSARLAETLAILVGGGVPLLNALEAATAVVWLLPLCDATRAAADEVREGMPLHRALARSGYFPPLLVHMVAGGETSGRLGEMLEKTARQQGDEVTGRLALAMSLLEPLLILAMGGAVLLIVLAILQPIIEINQLLR